MNYYQVTMKLRIDESIKQKGLYSSVNPQMRDQEESFNVEKDESQILFPAVYAIVRHSSNVYNHPNPIH